MADASTLSALISSMPNDSWAVISPANTGVIGGGLTTSYSDSAAWDPISKKLLYIGSDHAVGYDFVYWDDATNSWTSGPALPGVPKSTIFVGHAWDGNAADQSGNFYYRCRRGSCGADVFKYNVATNTWSALPINSGETNENDSCCQSLVYFPEMGGLIWITTIGQVWKFGDVSQTWSLIGQAPGATFGTWNFGEYNPVRKIVLFGGANGQVFKLTSAGVITQMSSLPYSIYDGSGYAGHVTVDPVTGIFIIITSPAATCHTYEVNTDTYGNCTNPPAALQGNISGAMIPVTNYGAILYFNCGGTTGACLGNIYVYKRAVGGTDPDFDFAARCAAPGVTKCQGFNSMGTFPTADLIRLDVDAPHSNIRARSDGQYRATVDTVIKRSGAGSLQLKMDAGYAEQDIAGQYLPNTNDGLGANYGENSNLFIQYAWRVSASYLSNQAFWNITPKVSIFHMDQQSCAGVGAVVVNFRSSSNKLSMYSNCGSTGDSMYTDLDGQTWNHTIPPYLFQQGDYACQFGNPPFGTCWNYPTDTWITMYFKIHVGNFESQNSTIEGWYAVNGGAYQKWLNVAAFTFQCNSPVSSCPTSAFNNITLTPYMTGLSTGAPVDAFTWYDELIVSTQPIAAPGQPPAAPPAVSPTVNGGIRRRIS